MEIGKSELAISATYRSFLPSHFLFSLFQFPLRRSPLSISRRSQGCRKQRKRGKDRKPGEPVAEADVGREAAAKIVGRVELTANVRREPRDDSAVGVHGDGEAVVRVAQQPAPIFDGA